MHKAKKYSYIAALFLFLTGFSHTFGTFMEIPKDQVEVLAGYEVMQKTIVPMPFGVGRSYAEIFLGTNLSVSLFLFLVGAVFILLAKDQLTKNELKILNFNTVGVGLLSFISFRYFFPLPGMFLAVSFIFGLLAKHHQKNK
jgi:hypothetical protein